MTKHFKKFKLLTAGTLAIMQIVAGLFFASIPTASAALSQVGPVDPNTTFPAWFRDANGLTLDLMPASDPNGISAPVVPGNNLSQQIGFGAEGFWWSADADIPTAAGNALLVQAIEAAFAPSEVPVDGLQSAFGRVRIRIDVPEPGTYTVTYPFGQKSYTQALDPQKGTTEPINDTVDIGCFSQPGAKCGTAAANYNLALGTEIGPFLTWDTFNVNPALNDPLLNNAVTGRQYVGLGTTPHAVTGSPTGNNFFRVSGPNIGGPGINTIETNLFTVTGRIALVAPTVTVNTQTATVSTPTITGTVSDPAATVSVTIGTNTPITATVAADGTWSAVVPTALPDGIHEVVASATNANGTGTDTTTNELTVNTGAPLALTKINVTPVNPTITVGGAQTFTAATLDQFNAPFTATVTWSSSNAAVGSINATTGAFTATAAGTTTITATSGAVTGTTTLTVNAVTPPPPAGGGQTPAGDLPPGTVVQPAVVVGGGASVSAVNRKGATVTWTTSAPAETKLVFSTKRPKLSGKQLRKRKGFSTVSEGNVALTHDVVFATLKKNKKYYFRVVTLNPDGSNSYGPIQVFKTSKR